MTKYNRQSILAAAVSACLLGAIALGFVKNCSVSDATVQNFSGPHGQSRSAQVVSSGPKSSVAAPTIRQIPDSVSCLQFDFSPFDGKFLAESLPLSGEDVLLTSSFMAFKRGFAWLEPMEWVESSLPPDHFIIPLDEYARLCNPFPACREWRVKGVLSAHGLFLSQGDAWRPEGESSQVVQLWPANTGGVPGLHPSEEALLMVAHPFQEPVLHDLPLVPRSPNVSSRKLVSGFELREELAGGMGPFWVGAPAKAWKYVERSPGVFQGMSEWERQLGESADVAFDCSGRVDSTLTTDPEAAVWIQVSRVSEASGILRDVRIHPVGVELVGTLDSLPLGDYELKLLHVVNGWRRAVLDVKHVRLDQPRVVAEVTFGLDNQPVEIRGLVTVGVEPPTGLEEVPAHEFYRIRLKALDADAFRFKPPVWSVLTADSQVVLLEVEGALGRYELDVPFAGIRTTFVIEETPSHVGTLTTQPSTVVMQLYDSLSGQELAASRVVSSAAYSKQMEFDLAQGTLHVPSGYLRGTVYVDGYSPSAFDMVVEPGFNSLELRMAPALELHFEGDRRPPARVFAEPVHVYDAHGGLMQVSLSQTKFAARSRQIDSVLLEPHGRAEVKEMKWVRLAGTDEFPAGHVFEIEAGRAGRLSTVDWGDD